MRQSFLFIIFIAGFTSFSSFAATTPELRVDGVRYGGMGGRTRIVLDLNRETDFRAFILTDPYRVVVDLPGAKWNTYKSRFESNAVIHSFRSGDLDSGLTRVLFTLKSPEIIERAFLLKKDGFNKDRLVIDLISASKNLFIARQGDVFGNKDLKKDATSKSASGFLRLKQSSSGPAAAAKAILKEAAPAPPPQRSSKKHVIVIDPGHGGGDPGASAHGVKEKNITLAVALELKRQLEETGRYRVVLTRSKDFYIRLFQRVDISREVGGDLFISIHADKIDRKGVRGASVYTLSETASDAETERLAEEENNAGFVAGVDLSQESQDVADILLDLAMREKMNESNLFARMLGEAFVRQDIRLLPNSHRSAGFAVLKAPDVPSVLIETGFLSDPAEAKLLISFNFQRKISSAILSGIDAYFRKIQSLQKP